MEGSCLVKEQYQGISGAYRRREPEKTVLYQGIQHNLETFLSQMREACPDHDPVPDYVEDTFRNYLECGISAGTATSTVMWQTTCSNWNTEAAFLFTGGSGSMTAIGMVRRNYCAIVPGHHSRWTA